ncbi:hypothetical protein RJT34_03109 [Clitoria ternatea]|uniref:NAC domain-containing protein n=1 Tax=Clitoria ternatea TaxID=43366 RepID=A0AAN9Q285_CLITE
MTESPQYKWALPQTPTHALPRGGCGQSLSLTHGSMFQRFLYPASHLPQPTCHNNPIKPNFLFLFSTSNNSRTTTNNKKRSSEQQRVAEVTRMQGELELPPGFRFHPTDDELVNHYLCRKCASQSIAVPIIKEIDLYKFDPWHLPEMALYGEKEWYFFSPRDRKYPNGSRPNRAAGTGYWKATGADKPIGKPKALGIKKALVFYAGKAPKGVKTNWIMHEYRLANVDRSASKNNNNNLRLDDWVLCRIYNKKGKIEKYDSVGVMNRNATKFSDFDREMKPEIKNMDTSDSVPRLHTDSSCSDHVVSPDVTCEKEVQSEPKWNELELGPDPASAFDFQLNFMDLPSDDPFAPQAQFQVSPWQDMFAYLPKTF